MNKVTKDSAIPLIHPSHNLSLLSFTESSLLLSHSVFLFSLSCSVSSLNNMVFLPWIYPSHFVPSQGLFGRPWRHSVNVTSRVLHIGAHLTQSGTTVLSQQQYKWEPIRLRQGAEMKKCRRNDRWPTWWLECLNQSLMLSWFCLGSCRAPASAIRLELDIHGTNWSVSGTHKRVHAQNHSLFLC